MNQESTTADANAKDLVFVMVKLNAADADVKAKFVTATANVEAKVTTAVANVEATSAGDNGVDDKYVETKTSATATGKVNMEVKVVTVTVKV